MALLASEILVEYSIVEHEDDEDVAWCLGCKSRLYPRHDDWTYLDQWENHSVLDCLKQLNQLARGAG